MTVRGLHSCSISCICTVICRYDVCDDDGQAYICGTGRGYRFIVKAQYSLSLSSYNVLMFYLPGALNGQHDIDDGGASLAYRHLHDEQTTVVVIISGLWVVVVEVHLTICLLLYVHFQSSEDCHCIYRRGVALLLSKYYAMHVIAVDAIHIRGLLFKSIDKLFNGKYDI